MAFMLQGMAINNLVVNGMIAKKEKEKLVCLLLWTIKSQRNKDVLNSFLAGKGFQLKEKREGSSIIELISNVNGGGDLSFLEGRPSTLFNGTQVVYGNVYKISSIILVPTGVDQDNYLESSLEKILIEQYPIPMEDSWKQNFLNGLIKRLTPLVVIGDLPYQSAWKVNINPIEIQQDLSIAFGKQQFIDKFKKAPMIESINLVIQPEKFDFKAWQQVLITLGGKEEFEKLSIEKQLSFVYGIEIFGLRILEFKTLMELKKIKFFELNLKNGAISIAKGIKPQVDLLFKAINIILENSDNTNNFLIIRSLFNNIGSLNLVELVKKPTELITNLKQQAYNIKAGAEGMAYVAADLWLSEQEFNKYQEAYLKAYPKIVKSSRSFPTVSGKLENTDYSWESMDMGNPRGWVVGLETNCCQHLEGAGKTCVHFAAKNPRNSGIFRVMKNNKTVAQSWIWFNQETGDFVFDNIEVLGGELRDSILDCYYQFIDNELAPRKELFGFRRACVGLGYSEFKFENLPNISNPTTINSLSENVYSDAKSQKLLRQF